MKFLTWNVRGLCRGEKRRVRRRIITKENPSMVFFQETKLKNKLNNLFKSLSCKMRICAECVGAEGLVRGLITM